MLQRAVLLVGVVAASAPAQADPAPVAPEKQALRVARALELPDQRARAADALLALGEVAVEPLLVQARHPDLTVARAAFQVLAGLGAAGLAAVPELERTGKGSDAHAAAARWTLDHLPRLGTFLVSHMEAGEILELDGAGKEVWRSPKLGKIWGVEPVGDHLLVAEVEGKVREYDRAGKVLWEYATDNPYEAHRLVDGNTLIVEFGRRQVVEVDPKGETVWKFAVSAVSASRLANGRTLIGDYSGGRVIEVDRDGKIAWEAGPQPHSYSVQRLADGSTLVVHSEGKCQRLDARGQVLAEIPVPKQPSHCVMLADGMMGCGKGGVERRDGAGKVLWQVTLEGWAARICPR